MPQVTAATAVSFVVVGAGHDGVVGVDDEREPGRVAMSGTVATQ
jgi:hypothetical protein